MALTIIDPQEILEGKPFTEDFFLSAIDNYDWDKFDTKNVLVRGCGSIVIPPWAFMIITARLTQVAKSVRYGNEHDNIIVYRSPRNT